MTDPVVQMLAEAANDHREDGASSIGERASELFGDAAPQLPVSSGHGGPRPGSGRKPGSPNRSSQELRQFLVHRTGRDALVAAYETIAKPMASDPEELQKFADHLECSRLEAFDRYLRLLERVFPYVYPKLASIELKPPGAPGATDSLGPLFDVVEGEGFVDITDNPYDDIDPPAPSESEGP